MGKLLIVFDLQSRVLPSELLTFELFAAFKSQPDLDAAYLHAECAVPCALNQKMLLVRDEARRMLYEASAERCFYVSLWPHDLEVPNGVVAMSLLVSMLQHRTRTEAASVTVGLDAGGTLPIAQYESFATELAGTSNSLDLLPDGTAGQRFGSRLATIAHDAVQEAARWKLVYDRSAAAAAAHTNQREGG